MIRSTGKTRGGSIGFFLLLGLVYALPSGAAQRTAVAGFELQSNFWVNLHERLLAAVRAQPLGDLALGGEEQTIWSGAVEGYRHQFGAKPALFDPRITALSDQLSEAPEDSLPAAVPADVAAALQNAAKVYRHHGWEDDDKANRFWIAVAAGMLEDAGEELKKAHSQVYPTPWPARVRVDVTAAAGPVGAYTFGTEARAHSMISSRHLGNQGFAALESLFHEASHAGADDALASAIRRHAEKLGVKAPPDLWHAIIFYTSGELTRRALAARGVTDYIPYAIRQGVYARAWPRYLEALKANWQPYLDGRSTLDEALGRLVEALR
ncbi:MAG TPA: hypothetical protein VOA87_01960 [Thermoanaerobaculia bacterium]|nr:hypothetical protein [Thermoanaerobaculia bacterium]